MTSVIWGWQQYFAELTDFLRYADRNFGIADEERSAHIIERLQVCMCIIIVLLMVAMISLK